MQLPAPKFGASANQTTYFCTSAFGTLKTDPLLMPIRQFGGSTVLDTCQHSQSAGCPASKNKMLLRRNKTVCGPAVWEYV